MNTSRASSFTSTTKKKSSLKEAADRFLELRKVGARPIWLSSDDLVYVGVPGEEGEIGLRPRAWMGFLTYDLGLEWMGISSRHRSDLASEGLPKKWGKFCERVEIFEIENVDFGEGVFGVGDLVDLKNLHGDLSFEDYRAALEKIFEYERAGDTYQINFTQPFFADFSGDSFDLFLWLLAKNPARHAFFAEDGGEANGGGWAICSNSPERLFSLRSGRLRAEPIKGTVGANEDPQKLLSDTKIDAELTMIVDLLRNDLGRVAKLGSVEVVAHKALMKLPNVWHTYSVIEADLQEGLTVDDVLKSLFPGGSVTGCPKKRSMEIIDRLESYSRGAYCGSAGITFPNGDADFNILIRTATLKKGKLSFPTGGGIVLDSQVEAEWEECHQKLAILGRPWHGIYETFRSFDGVYTLLPEHEKRWTISNGPDGLSLKKILDEKGLLDLPADKDLRVRVEMDAAGKISVLTEVLPRWDGNFLYPETWRVKWVQGARENPETKHTDTDFQVKEREKALAEGFNEIVLVDVEGRILEGGITNVFFLDESEAASPKLVTPSRGILHGISRGLILQEAQRLKIPVIERDVFQREISDHFRPIFLSNSIRGMIRIGASHPLVDQLAEACAGFIRVRLDEHVF